MYCSDKFQYMFLALDSLDIINMFLWLHFALLITIPFQTLNWGDENYVVVWEVMIYPVTLYLGGNTYTGLTLQVLLLNWFDSLISHAQAGN